MTHVRFGRSHLHPMGQLSHTRRSNGDPDPDGALKEEVRIKIRYYRNVYLNRPDPIAFLPLGVDTTDRLYDDFIRLLFLHSHRETSSLTNELPEKSDQFRFLGSLCFAHLKGSVGLIMAKASAMRVSVISVIHTSSSFQFHSFTSSHTVFSSFPRKFSTDGVLSMKNQLLNILSLLDFSILVFQGSQFLMICL